MTSTVDLDGSEVPEELRELAWRMFCDIHPHEAHAKDPEAFLAYIKIRAPHVSREQVEQLLKES